MRREDDTTISSYDDYRELIRNQTSASVRKLYDAAYYEKHVGDKHLAQQFFDSKGLAPTPFTVLPLQLAGIEAGQRILDVGCGRGEIVFQSAQKGADAVGIDYADAALEIARATRDQHEPELGDKTTFMQADATQLPFEDESFDRAFMLDVVEHLAPDELLQALREIRRVLRPDGRLVIHTSPNLWTRTYGFQLLRCFSFVARRPAPKHPVVAAFDELSADADYDPEKIVLHINEQSVPSLKLNLLRAGFASRVWLGYPGEISQLRGGLMGAAVRGIYKVLGLKLLYGSDIFAVARPRRRS